MLELPPLTNGRILSRYKRFLADVELVDGSVVTAHCPNTGAMTGCWEAGAAVQLSHSDNPKRKLQWTLERVDMGGGWIGVNTNRVNHFISSFVANNAVPGLEGYEELVREPSYSPPDFERSRFDLLLKSRGRAHCYVEVKNTTLLNGDTISFPDAITTRGRKHLELLQHAVSEGARGVILFAVNRPEGSSFTVAKEVDPEYHDTLIQATSTGGVEAIALRVCHSDRGVSAG